MRRFFPSFCRLIASMLLMTFLTSGIAMAAYICPQLEKAPKPEMASDVPCSDMDKEQPVQCAEHQAGEKQALEHFASAPSLTPLTFSSVMPAAAPVVPFAPSALWSDFASDPASDPPYLRTQRLRI